MSTHSSKSSRPRIPIPNTYDPITRQLKYVDKAHRLCVPNHIAASFTPHDNHLKYHMRTHTSIKTLKLRSGHLVAVSIISLKTKSISAKNVCKIC
jgi:hypothetical protein